MSHLVLSRKYRPQRFEDLVGQEHVARTLSQAILSGRIGHAYLFVGPRGTGKTTTARIFAKALNCEGGPSADPCGTCGSCQAIAAGNDFDVVEMDAASHNGVDDVRALRDSVAYRPSRSRFRIWIVDEVHMLSLAAFNAFLKTLEEPPPQAKFLFCTTEAHKLPETFTSRVQRLEFRRIDEGRMVERLAGLVEREGLAVEDGVCERIASGALGGLRDAESLLEQLLACAREGRVSLEDLDAVQGRAPAERVRAVFDAVLAGDAAAALEAASDCVGQGGKPDVVLDQWVEEWRGLLRLAALASSARGGAPMGGARHVGSTGADSAGADSAGTRSGAEESSARALAFGLPRIARSIDLLLEKRRHLREGADGRLVAEVAAVELARLPSARDLDALLEALRADSSRPDGAGAGPLGGRRGEGPPEGRRGVAPSTAVPAAPAARRVGFREGAVEPRASAAPPTAPSPAGSAAPAPAPSGAPAAPAGSGVGSVTTEAVAARWPELLAAAGRSRRLGQALAKCQPLVVLGDTLLVAIPEQESVARGTLRGREGAEAFREAAREVFGVGLRLAIDDTGRVPVAMGSPEASSSSAVLAQASPPPATSPPVASAPGAGPSGGRPPSPSEEARAHPQVRALMDAFDARVLAVQRVESTGSHPSAEGPGASPDGAGASGPTPS